MSDSLLVNEYVGMIKMIARGVKFHDGDELVGEA